MSCNIQQQLGEVDIVKDDNALGVVKTFLDRDTTDPNAHVLNSQTTLKAIFVKNDSGGTLGSGLGATYKSGGIGKTIGALSGANLRCDGVVDPFLGVGVTVADGAYFWLIIEGPIDVEVGAGDLATNSVAQTLANGKFGTGTPGTNPLGHSGISAEAALSGARARVFFNNPFSAVKG
jgi:hypothetical protein